MLSVLTFRTPDEAVEKANNTPYGLSAGVWTEKGSRILWMARAAARRRGVGEHLQPLRPGVAVRRLQGVRVRSRGRAATAWGLPEVRRVTPAARSARRTSSTSAARSRAPSRAARTRPRARTSPARSRKDARDAVRRPARRSQVVGRDRLQPRPGALPGGRDDGDARPPTWRRVLWPDEVERSFDRVVWYAGWADKLAQVLGGATCALHMSAFDPKRTCTRCNT